MALYLDLHPVPMFDRSLVTYCAVNFGRIKDVLATASRRIEVLSGTVNGPFPVYIPIAVPFRCDVTVWAEITFYTNATGMTSMSLLWDGIPTGLYFEMFFNESFTHKPLTTSFVIRNVATGIHMLGQAPITINTLSNNANRLRYHFTFTEV